MKFLEAARHAIETSMSHLAATTQQDLSSLLREHGRLSSYFGDMEIDEVTPKAIKAWASANPELRPGTVDKYLYAMGFVYTWAIENEHIEWNPVATYRSCFRKRYSKALREGSDPSRNIRPIDSEVARRILEAVVDTGYCVDQTISFFLLQLDAGFRVGEAMALRWGHVKDGVAEISENLPRGSRKASVSPKSGYMRRVQLSERLSTHLEQVRGVDEERVINPLHYGNFRTRYLPIILKKARAEKVRMKDFRDTYACTLLSCGIPIAYIAKQLGHSDVNVTARHYAQWVYDGWKPPVELLPGQVPADLLAITMGEQPQNG